MKNVLKRIGLLSLTILMLVSVLMLSACNGTEDGTTTKNDGTTTPSGTTSGNGGGETPDPVNPTYTVKIVDENGAPVQGVRVQFCVDINGETGTCTPLMAFPSNAEGVITITHMAEAAYKVKLLSVPSGYLDNQDYHYFNSENYVEITLNTAAAE